LETVPEDEFQFPNYAAAYAKSEDTNTGDAAIEETPSPAVPAASSGTSLVFGQAEESAILVRPFGMRADTEPERELQLPDFAAAFAGAESPTAENPEEGANQDLYDADIQPTPAYDVESSSLETERQIGEEEGMYLQVQRSRTYRSRPLLRTTSFWPGEEEQEAGVSVRTPDGGWFRYFDGRLIGHRPSMTYLRYIEQYAWYRGFKTAMGYIAWLRRGNNFLADVRDALNPVDKKVIIDYIQIKRGIQWIFPVSRPFEGNCLHAVVHG
jgi:hypothetical protein